MERLNSSPVAERENRDNRKNCENTVNRETRKNRVNLIELNSSKEQDYRENNKVVNRKMMTIPLHLMTIAQTIGETNKS